MFRTLFTCGYYRYIKSIPRPGPEQFQAVTQHSEHLYNNVCAVQSSFKSGLSDVIAEIQGAKLTLHRFGSDGTTQGLPLERPIEDGEPRLGDKLTVLINDISIAVRRLD